MKDIFRILVEARFQPRNWRAIGLKLGVKDEVLSAVERDNHKPEDCLQEVINLWLQSDPWASWKILTSAVDEVCGEAIYASRISHLCK